MSHDVTNFLPPDKRRAFRRAYFLRLGVLSLFLLAFLVIAHATLLVPSYLYAQALKAQAEAQLSARSLAALGEEQEGITARIGRLEKDAQTLASFFALPTATERFRTILRVPVPGIALSSVSIDQEVSASTGGRMRVTGTATTREALREYHLALSALPFVLQADLPLSAYAKEAEIDFAVDISLTTLP